jgi:hypothetical protein
MKSSLAYIVVITMVFYSCSKDKTEDVQPLDCSDEISFSSDISTLISMSCATSGCHNQTSGAAGYVFTNYENISNEKELILRTMRHEQGVTPMPLGQPKLAQEDIDKFYCWIEQGALNN